MQVKVLHENIQTVIDNINNELATFKADIQSFKDVANFEKSEWSGMAAKSYRLYQVKPTINFLNSYYKSMVDFKELLEKIMRNYKRLDRLSSSSIDNSLNGIEDFAPNPIETGDEVPEQITPTTTNDSNNSDSTDVEEQDVLGEVTDLEKEKTVVGELQYYEADEGESQYQIHAENPVYVSDKTYDLTDDEIEKIAMGMAAENGTIDGVKMEATLLAHLVEQRGKTDPEDYLYNSGWFDTSNYKNHWQNLPEEEKEAYKQIVRDVLVDGNRYLPEGVDNHDTLNKHGVSYIIVDAVVDENGNVVSGTKISDERRFDRSLFVPGETVIHNTSGAEYVFVGFAPTSEHGVKGDPFGYTINY